MRILGVCLLREGLVGPKLAPVGVVCGWALMRSPWPGPTEPVTDDRNAVESPEEKVRLTLYAAAATPAVLGPNDCHPASGVGDEGVCIWSLFMWNERPDERARDGRDFPLVTLAVSCMAVRILDLPGP